MAKADKNNKQAAVVETPNPARLKKFYKDEIAPALMKKYNYKSPMQIPKFVKVVVNVGVGDARENAKAIDTVISEISQITGQIHRQTVQLLAAPRTRLQGYHSRRLRRPRKLFPRSARAADLP